MGESVRATLLLLAMSSCGDTGGVCPSGTRAKGSTCLEADAGVVLDRDASPPSDGWDEREGGHPASRDASDPAKAPGEPPPECVPAMTEDRPDLEGADTNCDGFDGDLDRAVAVTKGEGPPGIAATAPTLAAALEIAEASELSQVWLPAGEHDAVLVMRAGVSVYGGFTEEWQHRGVSTLRGPGPLLVAEDIRASDTPTEVMALRFEADNATEPGASSIAGRVIRSEGIALVDVALVAGRGADGIAATQPEPAPSGNRGRNGGRSGNNGHCGLRMVGRGGSSRPVGAPCGCGTGGRGAPSGATPERGRSGQGIEDGVCDVGMPESNGGAPASSPHEPGGNGLPGVDGIPGNDGAPGRDIGEFTAEGYQPSGGSTGTSGGPGQGGGGGGAARDFGCAGNDFCLMYGATGASGGSGGCGGEGGHGGAGGGASVGLLLWDAEFAFTDVEIRSSEGGRGGDGAPGGLGGAGGAGGKGELDHAVNRCLDPLTPAQTGGDGGRGGSGGPGGGGGGGGGGPSVGIFFGGPSRHTSYSDVTFDIGAGGAGGDGGTTSNDGPTGWAGDILE